MDIDDMKSSIHPSTRAVISLSCFRSNLKNVRRHVANNVKLMAVVKSNAYGHGVVPIAREALRNGAAYLAVARVTEGIEIRNEGIDCPILVCELAPEQSIEAAIQENLELAVATVPDARQMNSVAERLRAKARVHVKVDTGMGRLGFFHSEAAARLEEIAVLPHLEIVGIFSHFATSEEPDRSFAHEQLGRFNDVLDALVAKHIEIPLRHMANSGAIFTLPESHFDMVRPGISLYGYAPLNSTDMGADLRPVMSLISTVSFMKNVAAGTSISYGRKYQTRQQTAIATVPIGYGDGFSRSLTNRADALIKGKRYPIVGTICMDHLMIDLGPGSDVVRGDDVTLIGRDGTGVVTCWDLAEKLGTIPYEITCLITPRVPRIFVD